MSGVLNTVHFRSEVRKFMYRSQMRRVATGVVRIVKPPTLKHVEGNLRPALAGAPLSLLRKDVREIDKTDKVTADVRIAELFRKFRQSPRNKDLQLSVLQSLSSLNSPAIVQFPGFTHLVSEMCELMNKNWFSASEVGAIVESLSALGVTSSPALVEGLSNQLVSLLHMFPPGELLEVVGAIELQLHVELDEYFYWAMEKALLPWAVSESLPAAEYIKNVLGPLQILTSETLFDKTTLLRSSQVQTRVLNLIRSGDLSTVLILELLGNMAPFKEAFASVIPEAVSAVLALNRSRLEENFSDLATLIAALPAEREVGAEVDRSALAEMLLVHLERAPPSTSAEVTGLLSSVADLGAPADPTLTSSILSIASSLVLNNVEAINELDPNRAANLLFLLGGLEDLSACRQLESVVVGRLPVLGTSELAKLCLAFASGLNAHPQSFKALAGTVRARAKSFPPNQFADAVYGLAYAGLLSKAALVAAGPLEVLDRIDKQLLPRFVWALAVAELSIPSVWDLAIKRLSSEVLSSVETLERLTAEEEAMLYEALVAIKVNKYIGLSGLAGRRLSQFEEKWSPPLSDYSAIAESINLPHILNNPSPQPFKLLQMPLFLSDQRLVVDAPGTHVSSRAVSGSAKLRHSLWTKLGYHVLGVQADAAAEKLQSLVEAFVSEVGQAEPKDRSLRKSPAADKESVWESRTQTGRVNPITDSKVWASRA